MTEPVFDRSGKYLYFFGSTDAGPLLDWFSQSSSDMQETRNVYLTVLRKDLPSPLAKESDEEKSAKEAEERQRSRRTPRMPRTSRVRLTPPMVAGLPRTLRTQTSLSASILDDIQFRILDMPIPAGNLSRLQAGNAGQSYLRSRDRRETHAAAIRPREAQAGDRHRRCGGLPAVD